MDMYNYRTVVNRSICGITALLLFGIGGTQLACCVGMNETETELKHLTKIANESYLAYSAALLLADKNSELDRLRSINEALRQAILSSD